MGSADSNAESLMNENQRNALALMTSAAQGVAIQAMVEVVIGEADPSKQVRDEILVPLSDDISKLDVFAAREVIDAFQVIRRHLGRRSTIHLLSMPVAEAVQPIIVPATAEDALASETEIITKISTDSEISEDVSKKKPSKAQKVATDQNYTTNPKNVENTASEGFLQSVQLRRMTRLFGSSNEDLLVQVNETQAEALIDALFILYEKHLTLSDTVRNKRKSQLIEHIMNKVPLSQLSIQSGLTATTLHKALEYSSDLLQKVVSESELREVVQNILQDSSKDYASDVSETTDETVPEIEQPTQSDVEINNEELFLSGKPLITLIKFFGVSNADLLRTVSLGQASELVEKLFTIFAEKAVMRPREIGARKLQMLDHVTSGDGLTEVGMRSGLSHSALRNYFNFASEALQKSLSSTELRKVIQDVLDGGQEESSNSVQDIESISDETDVVTEDATDLPENTTVNLVQNEEVKVQYPVVEQTKPEVLNTKSVYEELGDHLKYTMSEQIRILKNIFDTKRSQPDYSAEASEVYDDLKIILASVFASKRNAGLEKTLEFRLISELLDGANGGGILSARTVQSKYGSELGAAKRKFDEVIETGLRQIINAREIALGH